MLLAFTTGATGCLEEDPDLSASPDTVEIDASNAGTTGPLVIVGVAAARPATTTDERQHLLYELVLQNTSATSVEIRRVDVVDPQRHRAIARYQDAALAGILTFVPGADQGSRTVPPGGAAIAFFDLALAHRQHLPSELAHRITIRQDGAAAVVAGPTVVVIEDHARSLGPPLRGDRILAANACCDDHHRRAWLGTEEGLFLAQRFAIDFVRVDDRTTFAGDPTKNDSYFLFGAEVVAAGSGRIVEATDGMAENIPTEPLPPFDLETALGNHVIEELDDGRFVVYAHLQTGSVRVQTGERVRRGQALGQVGNTGNSTEPHLHFHVVDRASPWSSNGLPYSFDRFRLTDTFDITVSPPVLRPIPPPQQPRSPAAAVRRRRVSVGAS